MAEEKKPEEKAPVEEKKVEEAVVEEKAPATKKKDSSNGWEPHVSKKKEKVVTELVKKMKEYPIIGALNMEGMPAPQLQKMRAKLRKSVDMVMTKRRLMRIAIDEAAKEKEGLEKLKDYLKGMPALMFTKENPFSLYKTIKASKSPAPAKAGQTAPKDIIVPAGPTPFAPGPIISELGGVGITAGVEDGKVAVKQDSVVAKEGDTINGDLAAILTRLGIEPMEIGLDITGIYEDGVIYDRKVLDIDEDQFMADLNNSARWAFNLAVEIGHFTKETVNVLVPKAFREAKSVALEGGVMNDITREELIGKAEREALSIKDTANIDTSAPAPKADQKSAEEPKEEASSEENSAEEKSEEKPADEQKEDVKKAEETPKEEKKEEPEPPKEDDTKKAEPAVEQANAEASPQEEKEESIKEEIEEIKEEIKQEEKKEVPDEEHLKEIEKEVKNVEKEIKDLDDEESGEKEVVEELTESAEEAKADAEKVQKTPEVKIVKKDNSPKESQSKQQASQEAMESSENLFEELKKKGTLRGTQKEPPKPMGNLSPDEIIKKGIAETQKKASEEVPSAHDLAKKLQKNKS